jgi:hypothetical protein
MEYCNILTRNYLKSIAFRFTIQLQPHPAAAATAHAVLFAHTDSQVAHPSVSHLQQQPHVVTPPPPPHPPQSLPYVQACAQRQLLLLLKWCRSFDADGTSTYVHLAPSFTRPMPRPHAFCIYVEVNHDSAVPELAYRVQYNALKQRHGAWAKHWPECTDPQKVSCRVVEL